MKKILLILVLMSLLVGCTKKSIETDEWDNAKDLRCEELATTEYGLEGAFCVADGNDCSCYENLDNPCIDWAYTNSTRICMEKKFDSNSPTVVGKHVSFEVLG